MSNNPTPCRTTRHCADHGWCHRCDPAFAAVMDRVNEAIQSTDGDASHWGPLYAAIGQALRPAVLPAVPSCACGEPETPGTRHRTDGPCYVVDDQLRTAALAIARTEAHRRKWSYDRGLDDDGVPIKSEAFDALHRLGEDMRKALEELRRLADEAQQQPDTETRPMLARPAVWAAKRQGATVDPAMCPRCEGDNQEAFQLCAKCAQAKQPVPGPGRVADEEQGETRQACACGQDGCEYCDVAEEPGS